MGELYKNGKFYSMDSKNGVYAAMLVENGRIAAIGDYEDLKETARAEGKAYETVDLGGRTVLPGLIDSHMHLLEYGITRDRVFLGDAHSMDELVAILKSALKEKRLEEKAEQEGKLPWLIGYGFNQDYFNVDQGEQAAIPTKKDLDEVSRSIPVFITRACFHVSAANTKAMELAGITGDDSDTRIEGGSLDYGEDGLPNGIARENAVNLFYDAIGPLSVPDIKRAMCAAMKDLAQYGITTVHTDDFTAADSWRDVAGAYRDLEKEGRMTVRVYEQCQFGGKEELGEFLSEGNLKAPEDRDPDVYFTPGSLKIIEDGSLGARTAYLNGDYADAPGERGMLIIPEDELYEYMKTAHHAGMQIAVHAIGDGTIRMMLDLYQRLAAEEPREGLRHGIVHCQITDAELLARFRSQDILAYIQPIFLHYDLHIAESRTGRNLARTSYAWKTLLESGVHVSGGSDCPVEFFNAMEGIYCAVTRKDLNGQPPLGWNPEQVLSVPEAVGIFTRGGAYAGFEEAYKGSLEPGKLADFAVLSQDIFECHPDRIKDILVDRTVVGGRTVWDRESNQNAEPVSTVR